MALGAKTLAATGAVLALVAFFATRQPAPYDFLRGAEYEGAAAVAAFDAHGSATLGGVRRCYRSDRPFSEVAATAREELTAERGWTAPAQSGDAVRVAVFAGARGERVWIESEQGGSVVYVVSPPSLADRVGMWLRALSSR